MPVRITTTEREVTITAKPATLQGALIRFTIAGAAFALLFLAYFSFLQRVTPGPHDARSVGLQYGAPLILLIGMVLNGLVRNRGEDILHLHDQNVTLRKGAMRFRPCEETFNLLQMKDLRVAGSVPPGLEFASWPSWRGSKGLVSFMYRDEVRMFGDTHSPMGGDPGLGWMNAEETSQVASALLDYEQRLRTKLKLNLEAGLRHHDDSAFAMAVEWERSGDNESRRHRHWMS